MLGELLEINPQIQIVDLSDNGLSQEGLLHIVKGIK